VQEGIVIRDGQRYAVFEKRSGLGFEYLNLDSSAFTDSENLPVISESDCKPGEEPTESDDNDMSDLGEASFSDGLARSVDPAVEQDTAGDRNCSENLKEGDPHEGKICFEYPRGDGFITKLYRTVSEGGETE
jgi:hypothetical protein